MFIFGGVNDQSYLSGEIIYLETDEDKILSPKKIVDNDKSNKMFDGFNKFALGSSLKKISEMKAQEKAKEINSKMFNKKSMVKKHSRRVMSDFVSYLPLPRNRFFCNNNEGDGEDFSEDSFKTPK